METIRIRLETKADYRQVETLHRRAFWNLNEPGCREHYQAHILRKHHDFIPELDYVLEYNDKTVANVMYTKAKLIDDQGNEKEIVSFGPIGVDPDYQRKGLGKRLLEKTFEKVIDMNYSAIVIFGNPYNYIERGFKCCKKYNVCLGDGVYPTPLLVKEMTPGFFDGRRYRFEECDAFDLDMNAVEEFDQNFEYMEKKILPCQEGFYIVRHSIIR